MLTETQLDRLPPVAADIVQVDREITAALCAPVHDFAKLRVLRARRAELSRTADQRWGVPLRGDGPRPV
ncbi:hypothetical protein [Salinarimonas soli]|uniref:Chorismate mutase n=1 Tax=Salinarimonas soli TaxID=1638099 RepID=A0A5B2VGP8_9HYPH|nr:hypothetical protein [Salinarimonas soli]KAA2237690.1 hypothetical protein F0L46_08400 [Salinarimonas soli]